MSAHRYCVCGGACGVVRLHLMVAAKVNNMQSLLGGIAFEGMKGS